MRRASYLPVLLLGAATALAVLMVHRTVLGALLGTTATLAALVRLRAWRPAAPVAFAGGWLGVVLVAVPAPGAGGYLVGSDLPGIALLLLGLVVLLAGVVSIPSHGSGRGGPGA